MGIDGGKAKWNNLQKLSFAGYTKNSQTHVVFIWVKFYIFRGQKWYAIYVIWP